MTESLNDYSIGYYNFTNISSAAYEVYSKFFLVVIWIIVNLNVFFFFFTVVSIYLYMMEKNGHEFFPLCILLIHIFFSLFGDHNKKC